MLDTKLNVFVMWSGIVDWVGLTLHYSPLSLSEGAVWDVEYYRLGFFIFEEGVLPVLVTSFTPLHFELVDMCFDEGATNGGVCFKKVERVGDFIYKE